jgi:2-iminobutanoate/2-iminopropanoate deaminase
MKHVNETNMKKEIVQLGKISETIKASKAPISAVTKGAGLVFVSGLPPFDLNTGQLVRGDIRVQTRQCLENMKAAVLAAGSTLEKVLKVTVLVSNCAYWDDINAIYAEYFPSEPPARTFITVGAWAQPFDIEMEAIALA